MSSSKLLSLSKYFETEFFELKSKLFSEIEAVERKENLIILS